MKTVDELLTYGNFIDDKEFQDNKGNYIRYRLIELDSILYSLYMENGNVLELKEVEENIIWQEIV